MSRKRLSQPSGFAAAAISALTLLLPVGAMATALAGAPGDQRQHSDEIRSLTSAVLDLDQAARAAAESAEAMDDGMLIVYVGSQAKDLQLRGVTVQIDTGAPIYYQYNDQQSNSLQNGGTLHQFVEMPLTPGTHRLRVELVAGEASARVNTGSLRASLDRSFQKLDAPALIEVDLVQDGLLNKPAVRMREWSQGR